MKFDDCDEEGHLHKGKPKKNHWEAMHDFLYSFEEDKKISLYSLLWKYKSYEDGQVPKSIQNKGKKPQKKKTTAQIM